jgi:hypothetical protein
MHEDGPRVTLVSNCPHCGSRLVVVATPESNRYCTFSVECPLCHARVPLPVEVGLVQSVSIRE